MCCTSSDLLNVLNCTQPWFLVYAKKSVNLTPKRVWILSKLKLRQNAVISKLYIKIIFFSKTPYKYFVNKLFKLKKYFSFSYAWTFTQKAWKCDQKGFTTKKRLFEATKLRQTRKCYTTAGGDGWDIHKVCTSYIHMNIRNMSHVLCHMSFVIFFYSSLVKGLLLSGPTHRCPCKDNLTFLLWHQLGIYSFLNLSWRDWVRKMKI